MNNSGAKTIDLQPINIFIFCFHGFMNDRNLYMQNSEMLDGDPNAIKKKCISFFDSRLLPQRMKQGVKGYASVI